MMDLQKVMQMPVLLRQYFIMARIQLEM